MHQILNAIFGRAEEINGHDRCPTYLYRWTIFACRWFKVYLHKFVGDDWSLDFHDHPKRFISIGICGSYLETTPYRTSYTFGVDHDAIKISRRYSAPWIRTFPCTHQHRISTPWGHCWTLVIVGRTVREWGFWHNGKFIGWRPYVEGEGGVADKMKACD